MRAPGSWSSSTTTGGGRCSGGPGPRGPLEAALLPLGESLGFLLLFALLATVGSGLVERAFDTRSNELFLLRVVGFTALLAAGVVVTAGAKLATGYLGGRAYDLNPRRSVRMALARVTRGEFALVVAAIAANTASVSGVVSTFAVGYVLVMSILGTVLMGVSGRIEGLLGVHTPESAG